MEHGDQATAQSALKATSSVHYGKPCPALPTMGTQCMAAHLFCDADGGQCVLNKGVGRAAQVALERAVSRGLRSRGRELRTCK